MQSFLQYVQLEGWNLRLVILKSRCEAGKHRHPSSGKVGVGSGRRWIRVGWDHRRQVRLGLLVVATLSWSLTASAGGRVIALAAGASAGAQAVVVIVAESCPGHLLW